MNRPGHAPWWVALLVLALPYPTLARPTVDDPSPDMPNGVVNGGNSTAGLTNGLAGDESCLYAVALNAGVWRSLAGGRWEQLQTSPPRAYSIATDPADVRHVVVGERNGDAVPLRLNRSGVWESLDAGETWTYILNPLRATGGKSQAVPAVAFTRRSTLLIGCAGGIGRRRDGGAFDFSHSPRGAGLVTAFSIAESSVWARTADRLLRSADDGLTWVVIDIPRELEASGDRPAHKVTSNSRGDLFSLGATDDLAVIPYKPSPDNVGNHGTVLVYDVRSATWTAQVLNTGDGTGLGGRRTVKSFVVTRPTLRAGLGGRSRVLYCGGQDVSEAIGRGRDGSLIWKHVAQTNWGGPYGYAPSDIHPDIWDLLIGPDARAAWISCDGGVFELKAGNGERWRTRNDGLHTHHIHTLTVLPAEAGTFPRMAYATSDNDAWYTRADRPMPGDKAPEWLGARAFGDANWTVGDVGNPTLALMARRSAGWAMLTGFQAKPPALPTFEEGRYLSLCAPDPQTGVEKRDGPLFFQFIQTLAGESDARPLLDAVILADLPLTYVGPNRARLAPAGPLGDPKATGSVILRNKAFASNPDVNACGYRAWEVAASNLPEGARGLWVSGGHADPVFYVYTRVGEDVGLHKLSGGAWHRLPVSGLLDGSVPGPAFVNPFDPSHILALTSRGIQMSTDGGATFATDEALTALLTASGTYPLTGRFWSITGGDIIGVSRSNAMGTLSHVAFNRAHPNEVVAASPLTGVYFRGSDSLWRDLTPLLPRPLACVSAVAIDGEAVYIATEGRSVLRVRGYRDAPLASWFALEPEPRRLGPVAALIGAAGGPVAHATVLATTTREDGTDVRTQTIVTDPQGRVRLRGLPAGTRRVVHLRFAGADGLAPCEASIIIGPRDSKAVATADRRDDRDYGVVAGVPADEETGRASLGFHSEPDEEEALETRRVP